MNTQLERREGGEVRISGELSFTTVPALWRDADAIFSAGGDEVCFDLQAVDRTDSAGLALLIEWVRAAAEQGMGIRFRNIPAQLLDIARVSGVEALLSANAG